MPFYISPTDRVSILGKTGSGKSVLTKRLLAEMKRQAESFPFYYPIIVLDQKGQPKTFRGFGKRVKTLKNLWREIDREKEPILVYSPIPEENNLEGADRFFRELYESDLPNLTYVDELTLATDKNKPLKHYEMYMKQGRERLQSLWQATQNPIFVPHDFFSNADHFFVFDLLLDEDRKKIAGFAGKEVLERPADKHGFWYYSVSERNPVYYKNELPPGALVDSPAAEGKEEKRTMSSKWVISMFILGFVLLFVLAVWKNVFEFVGKKVPAAKPVTDFVTE